MKKFHIASLALFWLVACSPASADFAHGTAEIANNQRTKLSLQIEIAETKDAQEQGLMYRRQMAADHGMLFIMPANEIQSFWMRNTLIPLDMLFFDEQGKLVEIQTNRQPYDETLHPTQVPAKYVLEINGGQANSEGLVLGDQLIWQKTLEK